jgi:uncharacterized protein (DUF697 family)
MAKQNREKAEAVLLKFTGVAAVTGAIPVPVASAAIVATAGLQTWILGRLTIAICDNGGEALRPAQARRVVAEARSTFDVDAARSHARAEKRP